MMKKQKLFCCINLFAALLLPICTGCSLHGNDTQSRYFPSEKHYQDPLLPYIKADQKITDTFFREFVEHLDMEQKKMLWEAVAGKEADVYPTTAGLFREMTWASHHWATYPFKDFHYHETVQWAAKKLGIDNALCQQATTFQLEHLICEKLFEQMWDKLSENERTEVLKEAGLDHNLAKQSGAAVCTAISATLATGGVAAAAMGFSFYILMAKTVVVVAAMVGIPASATISAISVLCGPVGWVIAAVSAITAGVLVGQANITKCVAMIVQVHMFKINALGKSRCSLEQYLVLDIPAR